MDPYGKKELLSFYDRHLKDFGDHPQAVRWTPEGQIQRYDAFFAIAGDLTGKKLLDFGCGKGDFYGFLRSRGVSLSYCGIDVNEHLISLARSKYPGIEFRALDIEEERFDRDFDVIIACGVFNLRIGGIGDSMHAVLKILFGLCRGALHFNVLSAHAPLKDVELHYVVPDEILKFARRELSPRVTVRNDFVEGDMYLSVIREKG